MIRGAAHPTTARSGSNTTRSAVAPGTRPAKGSPNARAGLIDAWRTASISASSRGSPLWVTANLNTQSMVAVLPAMVSVPATRATPSTTSTPTGPSRYAPSAIPAAAIASVINDTRSGPTLRVTCRYRAGSTCTPSVISSTVTRGSSRSAITGPGERWWIGRHRVEQVRPHRRARRDRLPRLFVGRLGVADRGDHTRIDDSADRRQRSDALGRQGHHPNRPITHGKNAVELGRIRVAHQGRLVGTTSLGGQPGTFQMNPCDHAGANLVGQFPDLPYQLGRAGGDQRSNKRGGAVPKVQSHRGGRIGRGRGGKVRAAPAVHMGVDETWHHCHRAEVAIRADEAEFLRRSPAPCRPKPQSTPAATVLGRSAGCRRSSTWCCLRCPAIPAWRGRFRGSNRQAGVGVRQHHRVALSHAGDAAGWLPATTR